MVMYDYNRYVILTEAIDNIEGKSIVNAYETLYNSLATKVSKPRF